jgi:protein TonB
VVGGVVGGVPGGVLGGVLGGTGTAPLVVGGDVTAPELIHRVEPEYPELARLGRLQGKVILEAIINKDGDVEQIKVLRGNQQFNDAAMEAVRQWKYRPALQSGRPVAVYFTVVVEFSLR